MSELGILPIFNAQIIVKIVIIVKIFRDSLGEKYMTMTEAFTVKKIYRPCIIKMYLPL